MKSINTIEDQDKEVAKAISGEWHRIQNGVELIPSENFVSKAVLEAMSTVFTNKYAEGYPGKRYYGGNEFTDIIENLAIDRAKKLFKAEHVNVQPYSGSPANMAVFLALLKHGDTFMGLDLCSGGHLTHGSPVNFSGRLFNCIPYNVDKETHLLDMDQIRKQALAQNPKMIISGLTAYPRKLDFKEFEEICNEIGCYHFSDISHISGLCVTGEHESPVPFADVVTTTTHKTLRGPRGAIIMCKQEDALKSKFHSDSKKNLAQMIDFAVFPGIQGGPHEHIIAAKAVAFQEAMSPDYKTYSKQIVKNAKVLSEELMSLGIKLVTDGTDNHLMVIDLTHSNLTGKGKEIQEALDKAGIFTNKNTIPYEPSSPFKPSGIRIGTPAITSRGFKEGEMKVIAKGISDVINDQSSDTIKKVKLEILEICKQFPLYPDL
jgi:glycine hydroxymethyltransferase